MNIKYLLSIPKSVYICFRCLPFHQAVKLPLIIERHTHIRGKLHQGSIVIDSPVISRGMICLGMTDGSFDTASHSTSFLRIANDAQLVFRGECGLAGGFHIDVARDGILDIGDGVHLNAEATLSSNSVVRLGTGVRSGWGITIIDWDGHDIMDRHTGEIVNAPKPISIGDHTWLGAKVSVLKGVTLQHHTIIPYGSIITRSCDTPYAVFGASPNRILKESLIRSDKFKTQF